MPTLPNTLDDSERYSGAELDYFFVNLSDDDMARVITVARIFSIKSGASIEELLTKSSSRLRRRSCKRKYTMLEALFGMIKGFAFVAARRRRREARLTTHLRASQHGLEPSAEDRLIAEEEQRQREDHVQAIKLFLAQVFDPQEKALIEGVLSGHKINSIPGLTPTEADAARQRLRRAARKQGLAAGKAKAKRKLLKNASMTLELVKK